MKNLAFLVTCFILLSCSGKTKIPSDIIAQNEMQHILWDVIKAQALAEEMALKDSSLSEIAETKRLTSKVFEIHKITPSAFDISYAWYTGHPEVMRIIFDSMSVQNQRETDLLRKREIKPVKKGLLKKIKIDEQSLHKR